MKVRRRREIPPSSNDSPGMGIDEFLADTQPKKKQAKRGTKRSKRPALELAVEDAGKRARDGDWDEAQTSSLVGLYAMMHKVVYGVLPEELLEKASFARALRIAGSFARREFGGDVDAVAEFIVWTWEREEWRERRAIENGTPRGRLGIGAQFSKGILTDYKTDQIRRSRR